MIFRDTVTADFDLGMSLLSAFSLRVNLSPFSLTPSLSPFSNLSPFSLMPSLSLMLSLLEALPTAAGLEDDDELEEASPEVETRVRDLTFSVGVELSLTALGLLGSTTVLVVVTVSASLDPDGVTKGVGSAALPSREKTDPVTTLSLLSF